MGQYKDTLLYRHMTTQYLYDYSTCPTSSRTNRLNPPRSLQQKGMATQAMYHRRREPGMSEKEK